MTWTWKIDGLGTTEQTLRVFDPNGDEVDSITADGFMWSGDRPDFVYEVVAANDTAAALVNDIKRAQS